MIVKDEKQLPAKERCFACGQHQLYIGTVSMIRISVLTITVSGNVYDLDDRTIQNSAYEIFCPDCAVKTLQSYRRLISDHGARAAASLGLATGLVKDR